MLGATQDDRLNHLDGYGIKVLFNHGIRRFLTGAKNKDPSAQLLEEKTLYMQFQTPMVNWFVHHFCGA